MDDDNAHTTEHIAANEIAEEILKGCPNCQEVLGLEYNANNLRATCRAEPCAYSTLFDNVEPYQMMIVIELMKA